MNTRSLLRFLRRSFLPLLALPLVQNLAALPAFPGAEGFGAESVGGRGGSVYIVTNLNDSGAGSFRDAVSQSNRTVVFAVGGIIRINSRIAVRSNITIAGQTAPGDGITIYGNGLSFSNANNTICRYIRIREGIVGDSGTDAVGIASGDRMIFDHVSASWGRDETFSVSGTPSNITLQDCIIGQGLLVHSAGGLMQTDGGVSVFRCFYADNWMRNPKVKGVHEFTNNLVYNWGSGGGYILGDSAGQSYANVSNNYFIAGPNTPGQAFTRGNLNFHIFADNNFEDLNKNGVLDGAVVPPSGYTTVDFVPTRYPYPAVQTLLTPQQAYEHAIAYAGASLRRDRIDALMVSEVSSFGTIGAQIADESQVGGPGPVAGGLAPADADGDGMPDWWEQAAGSNPAVADNNGDLNGDGYTNLENYINSLAPAGVPAAWITGISTDTGVSSSDGVTSDNTLVISGTSAPGRTVTLSRVDTGVIGSAVADGSGQWIFNYTGTPLAERFYAFSATADLGGGAVSPPTPAFRVKVDATPAAAAVITGLVTSPAYAFNGTAEPNSEVTVTLVGVGPVGTATADGLGSWTALYSGAPLAPGVYSFTASAVDLAGNVGAASAPYVVDTSLAPPVFTGINSDTGSSATDEITRDTSLILMGTAPASSTVSITRVGTGIVGTATAGAGGDWSFDYTATVLPSATYTFTATASTGGSSSPVSLPFEVVVDAVAPTIPSIVRFNPASSSTTSSTLVFRVTFSEPVVNVDTGDFSLNLGAGVTGTIGSLTPVSASVYDVTVTGAGGDGNIRLDRRSNSTIADLAGNAGSSSNFTGGQAYTMRLPGSGVWTTTESGGLWSDTANWEAGAIASGSGATADFSTRDIDDDTTAVLDSPRTVGRVVFADADQTTAAKWTLSDGGVAANALTLATGGTPTIQVIYTGATGQSNPDIAAAGAAYPAILDVTLNSSAGLTKTGWGTAILNKIGTIPGGISVNEGRLKLGPGAVLSSPTLALAVSSQFEVAGGTFNVAGDTTMVSGTGVGVIVSAGTGNFKRIVPTNARNNLVKVTGGTMTATEVFFPRSADAANMFGVGLVVQGGSATFGTVGLGTGNSWGAMSVEGGSTTVTGPLWIGWQQTGGRGGQLRVLGGSLTSTDTVDGIVMSRKNGTNANNVAELSLLGGVTTAEKITLGFDATVNAGSATIALNGGELYLGSVGFVKNGVAPFATNINLASGVLGAKNDWSSALPMTFPAANSVAIKAADAAGNPRTIALGGVLGGAGGFAKTGAGTLVLGGANTFSGDVDVNAGVLCVTGSLAAGGTVDVNAGGVLAGTGTIAKAVSLNAGGRISPGTTGAGTLTAASLAWNGGGQLAFDLGAAADKLVLTGALTKGAAGAYEFAFNETGTLAVGSSYTLVDFASTSFTAADFTYSGLTGAGEFSVSGGSLSFTITSDGSGRAAFNAWMAPFGLPAGQNGPADDPDGDGLGNLLESVLALNPTSADLDEIAIAKVNVGGIVYPALQFTRRQARGDVVVDVRASLALDSTNSLGTTEVSATPLGDGTDLVVVRSNTPLAVEPRQFLRLFVKLH